MFVHIDIDSFFVSAHRSLDDSLKGIAVAVGGRSNLDIFDKKRINIKLMNENAGAFVTPVFYSDKRRTFESVFVDDLGDRKKIRGIVTTSSYEAREHGVKTAMPLAQALKLCPEMLVIPSDYPLYHRLSYEMHAFMESKIPKIEQYSIDEFFGDVSGWVDDEDVYDFARELQAEVLAKFDIPVSIGISKAKWIAKLATETAKPYGVFQVHDIKEYIKEMPVKAFPGIGSVFQERLRSHGIHTLGDIEQSKTLLYSWKKPGIQLYKRVLGIDGERVEERGPRKSIGIARTFDPIDDVGEVRRRVVVLARNVTHIVMKLGLNPTTYYLEIDYRYGEKRRKSWTIDRMFSEQLFRSEVIRVYDMVCDHKLAAVKASISVTNFTSQHKKTLSLLDLDDDLQMQVISKSILLLREKYGLDIVKSGAEL